MATFYLDYEGGSDAADGTSFANRWKTLTSGATAARIAPGDTIRVMGSPAPTSLGVNGTWTDGPLSATTTITSSTNATPIVITRASHGLSTGDTVVVTGHTTNTNANGTWEVNVLTSSTFELTGSVGNGVGGATGTFRLRNNSRVKLASAVTANIHMCDDPAGAWTASANVTATVNTSDFKEGYGSAQIAIAAGFTTGLAAYKALPALTDYSAYKQISFWIKQTSGTLGAAGAVTVSLCTDTVGAIAANTVNVPALTALNQWVPVTVDTGGALSALIQSVAFNVVTDNGAQTFLIDDIIACKDSTSADSLTLTSLIGKNSGNETWCAIQSINGTRVMLDQGPQTIPTSATWRGYSGTTETVTAYKRETIKTDLAALAATAVQTLQDSGSSGSLIAFEGGWDRTNMTTQNLETWFDGRNGLGVGITASSKTYFSFNKINCVRYTRGFSFSSSDHFTLDNLHCNNCVPTASAIGVTGCYAVTIGSLWSSYHTGGTAGMWFLGTNADVVISHIYSCDGCSTRGVAFGQSGGGRRMFASDVTSRNNFTSNIQISASDCVLSTVSSKDSAGTGIDFDVGSGNVVYSLTSSGNASGCDAGGKINFLKDSTISESTEVATAAGNNGYVFSQKHDGTTDNHQGFTDGGRIASETSVRHTASGLAWRMSPTSANRSSDYPLVLSIAKIACNASALVTVKAYMRRSNTALTMRLVCRGGQIAGVSSSQTASMTAAADTWEELSITFTPSEAGVVEITAEAYGGTTHNGYVDDMTITQA